MGAWSVTCLCGMMVIAALEAPAARADGPAGAMGEQLSPAGQRLQARYEAQLASLREQIQKKAEAANPPQTAGFVEAYRAEAAAMAAELKAMRAQATSKDKPAAKKAYQAAQQARASAAASAEAPTQAVLAALKRLLAGDALDAQLVRCVVLADATPRNLAAFAQQGRDHEALVETLLSDAHLMKRMLIAGGAREGQYARAMQIHAGIRRADPAIPAEGVLPRLALAICLEHAVPIAQNNPKAQTDAPATVDPVKRYLHYKEAFLAGELDGGFADLTAWELRMVVNGEEPDWALAWGREMLRSYRPDHVRTPDTRWRYVRAVNTEVKYGSQDVQNDRPTLQQYQNILMNGGVCGRRAFFGRFILRSFGIPTTRRPQRGHAALTHWTPDGWVINLGAGWGWGWTPFGQDVDFLEHTQARKQETAFLEVLRARWIAAALGEASPFGFHDKAGGFWSGVALYRQRQIAEEARKVKGDTAASPPKPAAVAAAGGATEEDEKIAVGPDGTITIPAALCSKPTQSTQKILLMESFLGGRQLHYSRTGKPEAFEYTFDAPAAGAYALTARVLTTSDGQHLWVAANGAGEGIDMAIPYTVGKWQQTQPVEVRLNKGRNVLRFWREEPVKGLTIKDFALRPVK